jgi:hypothetical protein
VRHISTFASSRTPHGYWTRRKCRFAQRRSTQERSLVRHAYNNYIALGGGQPSKNATLLPVTCQHRRLVRIKSGPALTLRCRASRSPCDWLVVRPRARCVAVRRRADRLPIAPKTQAWPTHKADETGSVQALPPAHPEPDPSTAVRRAFAENVSSPRKPHDLVHLRFRAGFRLP